MKKFLLGVILLLSLIILPKEVLASDKVTIYIFRGSTCNHCEEALNYINDHKDEINENIEIVTYEVFENSNNSKLQDAVAEKLGVDTTAKDYGVPFIVIGDKYIKGYGGAATFIKMMDIAEDYLDDDNYKDVINETIKDLNIKVKGLLLEDIFSEPSKVVTIVVYSIFGAVVLGIVAMIVFSRK